MIRLCGTLVAGLALLASPASAGADPRARSISSSKQFVVYCSDAGLRGQIATALEEAKANTLRLLGEPDRWKIPIVVSVHNAKATDAGKRPVSLTMIETPQGPTIQIAVRVGDDPAAIHLQKHAVRAVLLELAYRERGVRGGEAYVEPPWWLIAGAVESFRRRDTGVDVDLFRRLVETNRLPAIEQFLTQNDDRGTGSAAEGMDGACAMALVQLLLEQPAGRDSLVRFVRQWPETHGDPIGALTRHFPELTGGGVQKWWTLNLARFAASDRYKGLSMEDTDRELNALLEIELPVDEAGTKQSFHIGEFESFRKMRGARAALAARHAGVVALSSRANAIFRPVVSGYERVLSALARGKTRGLREQMVRIEVYRGTVLQRVGEIADYLNWYEATQFGTRSDAFDGFLRAARAVDAAPSESAAQVAIGTYLDELQKQL